MRQEIRSRVDIGRSEGPMNTQAFFRLSGLALVVGCVVSFAFHLVSAWNTTTDATQPLNIVSDYVLAAAALLLLVGLPGVYASRAEGFGIVGLVGAAFLFIATIMLDVFGSLWGAMVDPWLATQAPNLANGFGPPPFFAYYNIQEVLLVVGSVLLAIPMLRRRVPPRWPAFALLLSVLVGVPIYFSAFPNSLVFNLVSTAPTLLLLAAFVGLGYQTWSKPSADAMERPAVAGRCGRALEVRAIPQLASQSGQLG